ncbi:MAG: DUF2461 domain-containing protein [Prevotella sp.]|nr:DUF2461 domain-containing protein [Prevotella sp.]MBQ8488121.1 DUF2461 domain-containing protein [Prevotella sp.]
MNTKLILTFLSDVMRNNNREWFQAHRAEYDAARADFEQGVAQAIRRIVEFDAEIAHVSVKEATYRFYRDTRFSPDKSPYKHHFGAYINAHGKKALRGGYYIHLEPQHCLVAVGNYWLPTNILTSCRNEIMVNKDEWLKCVESKAFLKYYADSGRKPSDGETRSEWEESWDSPQGFGLTKLKTCPTGFPKDWEYVKYLRLKDYCAWHHVPDDFFEGDQWLDEMEKMFRAAKPMMDFTNSVIDDYE